VKRKKRKEEKEKRGRRKEEGEVPDGCNKEAKVFPTAPPRRIGHPRAAKLLLNS
jgi:hypothetical protein